MARKQMTTHQHLIPRNGVYYFRMRVPLDVAEAFGKSHVQKSLRTKDVAEAGRARDIVYLHYQAEFEALRAKVRVGEKPSEYSIVLSRLRPLLEDWMQTHLQRIAAETENEKVDWSLRSEWQNDVIEDNALLDEIRSSAPHRVGDVVGTAKHILAIDGAPADLDQNTAAFRSLCEIVSAAVKEVTNARIALLEQRPFAPSEHPMRPPMRLVAGGAMAQVPVTERGPLRRFSWKRSGRSNSQESTLATWLDPGGPNRWREAIADPSLATVATALKRLLLVVTGPVIKHSITPRILQRVANNWRESLLYEFDFIL